MEAYRKQIIEAADFIRARLDQVPEIALVLGTGLSGVADAMTVEGGLPYGEIPNFPVSTVTGHQGRLLWGTWSGRMIFALQGRFHLYEGYTPLQIAFPFRVLSTLGVRRLLISNAAGGLNPLFRPGDLMLLTDHINHTGHNPLIGPNLDDFGVRFPDMTEPYSRRLQDLAERIALENSIALQQGVYVAVSGPSMETAAETRFLRAIGADAVGMSTVMEVITAVHAGMEILGVSVISNVNRPDCYEPAPLEKVIATAEAAGPRLVKLIEKVLEQL